MAWGTIALTARPRTPLPARMTLPPTLACGSPACIVAADHSRAPMRSPRARLPEPSEPLICQVESRGGGRGRDAHSLLSAPRTEPYVRLSRIRLPPWVFDGEAVLGPWVKDARRREEAVQAGDQRAGNPGSVAAPFKGGDPELDDPVAEGRKRSAVGRHGVVVEEASDHACQPRPGLVEGLMHPLAQRFLDLLELRSDPVASGFPLEQECSPPRPGADEGEAQEVEGIRFSRPRVVVVVRCMAAKRDDAGLARMQGQGECLEPGAHRLQEAPRLGFLLEAGHKIVGIA